MAAWRCENRHIMAHFDADFHGYVLTTGMCSCDLYSSPSDDETPEEHTRKLQEKYKEKGWSGAKIQRAINDATAAEKHLRGLRADTRELIARVAKASKRVYVFVHMYSGDQMTEKVVVKHGPSVPSSEFRSGTYLFSNAILW